VVRHERGRSRYPERRRIRGGGVLRGDVHCRRPYTQYELNGIVGEFANANGEFDISSTPVPLLAAAWLLLSGLGGSPLWLVAASLPERIPLTRGNSRPKAVVLHAGRL
jgi:hypothetical protein